MAIQADCNCQQTFSSTLRGHTCKVAFQYGYDDVEQDSKTVRLSVKELDFQSRDTHVRESFSTADVLALMRLLTSVSADMNRQRASLDEALATSWCHA